MIPQQQAREIAKNFGIDGAMFLAFIEVESGGKGFDAATGKLIIQFEPAWFKRKSPYAPSGLWSLNKVDRQEAEWDAFNNAYSINPNAAMESTSIGLPQIMGFNYAQCGYSSVNKMWDDFKKGEYFQVLALARFIKMNGALYSAIKRKDFDAIATIYNGKFYKELAKKIGRESYDISLSKAYKKYSA